MVEARVVAFCIICDKIPNAILNPIFVNYLAYAIGQVFTTMTAFDTRQTQKKCSELPFIVKEMNGEASVPNRRSVQSTDTKLDRLSILTSGLDRLSAQQVWTGPPALYGPI